MIMEEHNNQNIDNSVNEKNTQPINVETKTVESKASSPSSNPAPKKKESSANIFMKGLFILACGVAGFGGGMLQDSFSDKEKVVISKVENTTDNSAAQLSTTTNFSVAQVAAKSGPSVVEIKTEQVQAGNGWLSNYVLDGAGSGVIVSEDGYILTNAHVVEGATTIQVTTSDGTDYQAKLVGSDTQSDVAVIKIEAQGLTAATIGTSENLVVGEPVVAIGNPLGELGGSVTDGIISAVTRSVTIDSNTMNVIQTNAAISPGNSGGGLFNANGELIGIVNAKSASENAEGIGFALPIDEVMEVATDLMNVGYVTNRPALGVTLQTISYIDGSSSLVVSGFADNSQAQSAGLKVGDVIIGADGTSISAFADLRSIINSKSIGDSITLTVIRENNLVEVSVPLVEMTNSQTTQATQEPVQHGIQ